ncbi:MAG: acetoacetate--CoA ligase [Halioglobus sp.]|nr:acetoacetate--CoA ligase [Halioglobus sp.]
MQQATGTATREGELLWRPAATRVEKAGLYAFRCWVNEEFGKAFETYDDLWRWSVAQPEAFWESIWRFYEIAPQTSYARVLSNAAMPGARWFEGAKVNFAEHLLRQGALADLSRTAVFAESESLDSIDLCWAELRQQVVVLATYLREAGVQPGDRIVAYLPMSTQAVVALLACASVGAVWSCCSPDFGVQSVVERFGQIQPKLIIAIAHYRYNGKAFDRRAELSDMLAALPTLTELIYLPWADADTPQPPSTPEYCKLTWWRDCLGANNASYATFDFAAMPFEAPLWISYSSGTTGAPKGIVHSQGGALVEYVKYAWLQDDMHPAQVKFFVTTTGWTMFNILIGGMMAGAAIVVYDGSPTWPDHNRLWDIADRCRVTYFGASPGYVNALVQAEYSPQDNYDLSTVKTIALTGSPSSRDTFRWCYKHVHDDLHVISMSGGTDVSSAFIAGASELPVYAGEIQCACLGVDVAVFDGAGNELPPGEDGELVIRQPMPSMPIYFWADPEGKRYRSSYFDDYPGVWRHGDLVRRTSHGGFVISGRSDATLNRFGVRIGTAEIYRALETIADIKDSMVVSVELPGAQCYMPLFVVLQEGVELSNSLLAAIRSSLSSYCSPRHVPDEVCAVDEVPYTLTGKKLEVPVKKLLMGTSPAKALNRGAMANPAAMDFFIHFADNFRSRTDP